MKSRNAEAWAVLVTGFPSFNLTAEQVAMWDHLLSDQSPEALLVGARALVRESKYPTPTVAGWLEHARNCDPERVQRLTAAEAWAEMQRNRGLLHGARYESREERRPRIVWSSEAVHRAAEAVSWRSDWEGETIGTVRAQFERYYTALADKTERIDEANAVHALVDNSERMKRLYGPEFTGGEDE